MRRLYTDLQSPLQAAIPQLAECSIALNQRMLAAIAYQSASMVISRLLSEIICQYFSVKLGM